MLPHRGSLYLRSGDTFSGSLRFSSGRYPSRIGIWGGNARAVVVVPAGDAEAAVQFIGDLFYNVTVSGLELRTTGYTGWPKRSAFVLVAGGANISVIDCYMPGWSNAVVIDAYLGTLANVRVERNVAEVWTTNAGDGGAGIYLNGCPGAAVVENVVIGPVVAGRVLSHGLYANPADTYAFGNYVSRASRSGLSLRGGGLAYMNWVADSAQGICTGLAGQPPVSASIVGNVIEGGANGATGQPLGHAVTAASASVLVHDNLLAWSTGGSDPIAVKVYADCSVWLDGNTYREWWPRSSVDPSSYFQEDNPTVNFGPLPHRMNWTWIEAHARGRAVGAPVLVIESVLFETGRFAQ